MHLLLLGGTLFLGRHVVEAALAGGHEVTLFHRGKTNPELFPGQEHVLGDRDGGLAALRGRRFDAVIDTCGYVPRLVGDSARLLADTCGHYTFVSSLSAYELPIAPGSGEAAPPATMEDESIEEITNETYGPLKTLCEQAADTAFGAERTTHIRAGFIVGPHDRSDRFTYWPVRIARGGEVLCSPWPEQPMQFVDVRDLAVWMVGLASRRETGPFNATGPAERLTLRAFVEACRDAIGSDATFVWPDEDFAREHEAMLGAPIPLLVPPEVFGLMDVSIARARAAGLVFRPLAETVCDTLAFARSRSDAALRAGPTIENEERVLTAWRSASGHSPGP